MMRLVSRMYPDPKSWEDLETLFDACYRRAEEINRKHDPALCDIRDGQCARARNTGSKPFCCGAHADFPGNQRCGHLGPEGCTVKSLRCKLWFCEAIRSQTKMARVDGGDITGFQTARITAFLALVDEAGHYGFLVHRGDRDQSLIRAATKWKIPVKRESKAR